jgi:hypothetical protein
MNFLKKMAGVTLLAGFCGIAQSATDYFVGGPTASDSNGGTTPSTALARVNKAIDKAEPGSTIYLMNGEFAPFSFPATDGEFRKAKSGAPGLPITVKPYMDAKPVIKLTQGTYYAISIGGSYITIEGLEVVGNNLDANVTIAGARNDIREVASNFPNAYQSAASGKYYPPSDPLYNSSGITNADSRKAANPLSHHIIIRNNTVRNFGCAGIGLFGDYLTVQNNLVTGNAWFTRFGCSGISVFTTRNFDNLLGVHNEIINNKVWDNKAYLKTIAAESFRDGNGIIIDSDFRTGEFRGKTLVTGNISAFNGGSGIHAFEQNNVDIVNNVVIRNGLLANSPDIYARNSDNTRVLNNIVYLRPATGIAAGRTIGVVSVKTTPKVGNTPKKSEFYTTTYDCNLYFDGNRSLDFAGRYIFADAGFSEYRLDDSRIDGTRQTKTARGPNDRFGDPQFISQALLDSASDPIALSSDLTLDPKSPVFITPRVITELNLRVRSTSPAVNGAGACQSLPGLVLPTKDRANNPRVIGAALDIGVYEQ